MDRIYLDHAATSPMLPAAREALVAALDLGANPSSVHRDGQRARRAVERARERVAASLGVMPDRVVFTSGATEADNHALRVVAAQRPEARIVTARTEHAAVVATATDLARRGAHVEWLEPGPDGRVTPSALEAAVAVSERPVGLVALMHTNNETGVVHDVPALAAVARSAGARFLCDAVQGYGYADVRPDDLGADLLAVSAHKIGGPMGVGALILPADDALAPLLTGGSQERGVRPGTHNLPAIVGFGAAAEAVAADRRDAAARVAALRDRFEAGAGQLPGVAVNGAGAPRGPKHSNLRFEGVDADTLLMALDAAGVAASAGSACHAGSLEPSEALLATGLSETEARGSVRFTFGRTNRDDDPERALAALRDALERARRVGRARSVPV